MKITAFTTAALVTALAIASPLRAEDVQVSEGAHTILAQFNVDLGPANVNISPGSNGESGESTSDEGSSGEGEAAPAAADSSGFDGFSGDLETYGDDYNGFAIDIPAEFPLNTSGQTTDWIGPIIDGGATSIYINAAPIPGVSSQVLYDANIQQYQQDRFYTDIEPVEVLYQHADGTTSAVPAFRVSEVDNRRGSRETKAPDDIHRWHLLVFGNERSYTLGFTGMFQTFQDGQVQELYDRVIDSVALIPIVE